MTRLQALALLTLLAALPLAAQRTDATFGTVVSPTVLNGVNYLIGGASDLVLDEARARIYLVNTSQRRVEVYSLATRRFVTVVQTDATPMSAALSADGNTLYVTCFDGANLNVIDLQPATPVVARRVTLPAKPEGVAVGLNSDGQERVLLTTIGTGQNNTANVLLIFDPSPEAAASAIQNVIVTPPPPPSPLLPAPSGRVAFAARTNLIPTPDRRFIIGFAANGASDRTLFVYSVDSGTVLRSRRVNETSTVLSVSPDGTKFMAGLRLFDAESLSVLAQQSAANLPYSLPSGANFNVQQNQGGSVFSPDGSVLYTAFNFAPVQTPAARANVSQFLFNDPDNLLTSLGVKLPENISGNMIISSDGATVYALSESGFLIIPLGALKSSPLAVVENTAVFLASDQCGVTSDLRSAPVAVRNDGAGRFSATPQLATTSTATGAFVPTAPSFRTESDGTGARLTFTYAPANARSLGSVTPFDYSIYAPEAVNIPSQIRVFQNMRDAEARASVLAVPVSPASGEGLVDMVADAARQRLYIANSGLNRVEVFDMASNSFLAPIKVGQRPRSLALTPDGNTLYVAHAGGESIYEFDAPSLTFLRRIRFPALPFNSFAGIMTPSVITATERGLQIVMSNGTLWQVIDGEAMPRETSPIIGSTTVSMPATFAATPGGEFALLLAANGNAYLYDALSNEYVQGRTVFTAPIQGFYGPIAAGPRGAYFVANGVVLNQALSIVSSAAAITIPGTRPTTVVRPIAAVAPAGASLYARFSPPVVSTANAAVTEQPTVELVDPASGAVRGAGYPAVESVSTTLVGASRANSAGRIMALDDRNSTAYVLTASGLSVIPLITSSTTDRPIVTNGGVVNFGSLQPAVAPGSLISINGRNLALQASVQSPPYPTRLANACVTLNNSAIPLIMTSPGQINAQIPPELAAGRYPLIVRNLDLKSASASLNLTVSRYAPAVLFDDASKRAAIYHLDGSLVTPDRPARRDERIHIFATGLGAVTGVRLSAGQPAPEDPPGVTAPVQVFFDDPTIRESAMDVEESVVVPGLVGVYRIQIYVPWYRRRGDALTVTLRIGNVDSPLKAPALPTVAVE